MPFELTPDVCMRLLTHDDYRILVEGPCVQVVNIVKSDNGDLYGFAKGHEVVLSDGTDQQATVIFAADLNIEDYHSRAAYHSTLEQGSVIKIQRMLRFPEGNGSVIVVHDIEVYDSAIDSELQVTDLEADRDRERALRLTAESRLRELVQPHVAREIVDEVVTALVRIAELADAALPSPTM